MYNPDAVLRLALDECLAEAGMNAKEMREFVFRLVTRKLNKKDLQILKKRNRKARLVIH